MSPRIKTVIYIIRIFLVVGTCCIMSACMMGGSAEQGNARISGALQAGPDGDPVLAVHLVGEGFNPLDYESAIVCSTKTDSSGLYAFENVPYGEYYFYAFNGQNSYVLLDGPHTIAEDEQILYGMMLDEASVVTISDSNAIGNDSAFYYIKGMSSGYNYSDTSSGLAKLIGVPSGVHDVMKKTQETEEPVLYTGNLEILPGDSITISRNNRPPRIDEFSLLLPETVYVDTSYMFDINATDPDSDSVFYSLSNGPQSCMANSITGVVSWTPALAEAGFYSIVIEVSDASGANSVLKWNVRVKTPTPSLLNAADTFFGYDTTRIEQGENITDTVYYSIFVETFSLSCVATPYYRFFCNDEAITGWTIKSSASYAPDSVGIYEFRAEAWCDTVNGTVSDKSEPYTVTILYDLPPPVLAGDTLYDPVDPDTLRFQITSPDEIGGVPIAYRVRFYNRSLAGEYDSTSRVATVLMTGTCSDSTCTDTAICTFDTYTSWLYGKTLSVMLLRPQDSYSLFVQARIDERKVSEETVVFISPR